MKPIWITLLAGLLLTGPSAAIDANIELTTDLEPPSGQETIPTTSALGGTQLWRSHYSDPGNNIAEDIAVSPTGGLVFVTGISGQGLGGLMVTIAYDTLTGAEVWRDAYNGPAGITDKGEAVTVGPLGDRVYVTGYSFAGTAVDYFTIAYDAATGTQFWTARYDGPGHIDQARDIQVSPDGSRVFITGSSDRTGAGLGTMDIATIAYDAETGQQLWLQRHGDADNNDDGRGLVVSPDSKTVYVAGNVYTGGPDRDYGVIAYDAETGDELWVSTYASPDASRDYVSAIAMDPNGQRVYVTGGSESLETRYDATTVAYDAATGDELWVARHNGPNDAWDDGIAIAASPNTETVYVAATVRTHNGADYAAIAYDAATGEELWHLYYDGGVGATDTAHDLAVSPSGDRIYITGQSFGGNQVQYELATIGIDTATGELLWDDRYDSGLGLRDYGRGVAVDPLGLRVYATGFSRVTAGALDHDYTTIAYLVDEEAAIDALLKQLPL